MKTDQSTNGPGVQSAGRGRIFKEPQRIGFSLLASVTLLMALATAGQGQPWLSVDYDTHPTGENLQSAYLLRERAVQPWAPGARPPLQAHFDDVLRLLQRDAEKSLRTALARLEASQGASWPSEERETWQQRLAAERERNLAVLREYQARGLFPVNDVDPDRAIPIFVDRRDTACAVGYLMLQSGAAQAVEAIVQANNLVYVTDAQDGPLVEWILTSGLTQEEAALIQPGYIPTSIEWTPVDQLADEPRTLENLRFSSFALSATPDPDLPAGATNASPESIHLGVGPDPWGNRPPVSDDFAERYPRLAGVAVLTEEPLGVDTWWEFEQEAWLRSTNSAVSGHAVAHEFRVEPDSFQSLGEVGTEVVLSTQEGGRILVTTRIFGADDELLGALVIDTDDPDSFSQWPYHPLQPLHFEPATSLRISTTIQAWGDAAFGWIVYGFGAAGPPFTYRLVEGTVEITGFVDGIGAEVTVPSEIGGLPVTRIGDRAFLGADEIVSITLPSTVTSIGRYAIAGCHGLTRVDLPDQLTRIEEGAFADCPSLTAILVDPGNAEFHSQDGVLLSQATKTVVRCPEGKIGAFEIPQGFSTVGPGAFAGCRSLTEIMIPDSITVIGESAFRACVALREVDLPSGLTQVADGLFVDCQELQRVSLPDSVTAIGNYAFVHCAELADISIPKNVVSIGENAFYGCMALTRIVVPPGVTDIPSGAFQGCSGLYAVVLSEGLASIGARTFASCISLTSVIIPESVSWILEGAFYGCTNLERVYFAGNAPSLGNGVFGSTPASLYYLPGSSGWSSPFGGRPAVLWNPRILTNDGTLGMHAGQFGFIIMGAADVPVAVEACWDLANPDWTTITHLTCGADGTVQFTDHEVASHPTRIYRFRPE